LEILNDNKGRRVDGEKTICEVHRTIADLLIIRLKDQPAVLDEIMPFVNDAYKMGIRLVLALIEKKIALPEWEKNNVALAMKLRKERVRLVKELNEIGCCL
jgi:hypothetical protein